jgi:hypothetical protein
LVDFKAGTRFGTFDYRLMKLSNKDLLILLGIVVAVIITLTTLVYTEQAAGNKAEVSPPKRTSLNQITTDLLIKTIDKVKPTAVQPKI